MQVGILVGITVECEQKMRQLTLSQCHQDGGRGVEGRGGRMEGRGLIFGDLDSEVNPISISPTPTSSQSDQINVRVGGGILTCYWIGMVCVSWVGGGGVDMFKE